MRYWTQRSEIEVADDEVPPSLYIALSTVARWATVLNRHSNTDEVIAEAEEQRLHALRAAIALGCSDQQIRAAIGKFGKVDVGRYRAMAIGPELSAMTVNAGMQRDFIAGFTPYAEAEFGSLDIAESELMALSPRFMEVLGAYEEQARNDDHRNALRWKLAQYRFRPQGDYNGPHGPDISSLYLTAI